MTATSRSLDLGGSVRRTTPPAGIWTPAPCRSGSPPSGCALTARCWPGAARCGTSSGRTLIHAGPTHNPSGVILAGVAYSETGRVLDTTSLRRLAALRRNRERKMAAAALVDQAAS